MAKRITRNEFEESLGAFKPTGYSVVVVKNDADADAAAQALRDAGFAADDVYQYTSAELHPKLDAAMRNASGAAGFGYEIVLMRRYLSLSTQGAGFLLVYSPDDEQIAKVKEVAKRFAADSAVHYGRLVNEDLV